jgi:hypothetical protein
MARLGAQGIARLNSMCPAAHKVGLGAAIDGMVKAGTLTVNNAGGTGTIPLAGYGTAYVIVLSKVSGPNGCFAQVTKNADSAAVAIVSSAGAAVDCSTTNAVYDWLVVSPG